MVANITTGKDIYGALAYNQRKVDRGKGTVLATSNIRFPADGRFGVAALADELLRWMPSHIRTEKPVVHISLNPDPEDRLSDDELTDIAAEYMEGMGWGCQPYVVYKHTDIDRPHIHIVTVQVDSSGRKIGDNRRNERSVAETERIERKYGLHHYIMSLPNGYDTVLDDKASLSQGQRQLLTIARAMVEDAPILILDEATSSVDTRTEELIQKAMDALTVGRTSFVIAHRLSTIRDADMILVMNGGDIVERGTHEELLAKGGFYADIYNSQFTLAE